MNKEDDCVKVWGNLDNATLEIVLESVMQAYLRGVPSKPPTTNKTKTCINSLKKDIL